MLTLSFAFLDQKIKVEFGKGIKTSTPDLTCLFPARGGVEGVVTSSKGNYPLGLSLEALLGGPSTPSFLAGAHREKGVPDAQEAFLQSSQAVAIRHDLTLKSTVRPALVKPEKSEEMMARR